MTGTEIILQLIKFVVPSIAVFGAAYFFTNKWFEIQKEKIKADTAFKRIQADVSKPSSEDKASNSFKKDFFPLQVDAYQRLVLFLERISPNNMVMRMNNPGLPARAFQQQMLESIRQEYEHNLAQQIFVSGEGWQLVVQSKDEISKIINMASQKLGETALAIDLSKAVLEITAQLKQQPTDVPIAYLKAELNKKLI